MRAHANAHAHGAQVELCSNEAEYTPYFSFAPRCAASPFSLGQTATAFQLAGCC